VWKLKRSLYPTILIITSINNIQTHTAFVDYEKAFDKLIRTKLHSLGYLSGIELGYGLDDRGFESRQRQRIFLFTTVPRLALVTTQPPIQWVPGASLGIARRGREADRLHPSSAKVKNEWSYTSVPQYAFMAW
jgi:hypothetical protein